MLPLFRPRVIEPTTPQDVHDIVDELHELARSNKVDGIAVAVTLNDGRVTSLYCTGDRVFSLLGIIGILERRLQAEAAGDQVA